MYVWDWEKREVIQIVDLDEGGLVPLEIRFMHNPEEADAFVGAALSLNMFRLYERDGTWHADKVIDVEPREHPDWDMPVPGLITDLVLSMDDRYLFFANWLHGEVRMYDVSDPANPRLADTLSLGGMYGDVREVKGRELAAGPQMLQLSLAGTRLYFTTSLYSSWDNQFFPDEGKNGSLMFKLDVDPRKGTMTLDEEFLVDFGDLPEGPARAHEIHWPDADCTSDIFI